MIASFATLELQQVSPKLLAVHDLDLAVPGTYQVGKAIVRIIKFAESFDVLTSKQRSVLSETQSFRHENTNDGVNPSQTAKAEV